MNYRRTSASSCAILASTLLAIAFAISCSTVSAQYIYQNDFDQHTYKRTYKIADLNAEWNNPLWDTGVSEYRVKVESGYQAVGNSGSCLAVKSPKGTYGPQDSGAQWIMEFDDSYEEVYLSYCVKFKKSFDFVKGGKLPGLAGGTAPTGFTKATGYNGWTARMMWRTGFTGNPGSPKQKTSNAVSYAKYVGSGWRNDGKNEEKVPFRYSNNEELTFKSNRWYSLTQRIKMNDPFVKNGELQIWVDGVMVVNEQNLEFRKTYDLGIDKLYFSNFFGGGSSWRTSKYETLFFDDFSVYVVR